jgi:hypothetical protein
MLKINNGIYKYTNVDTVHVMLTYKKVNVALSHAVKAQRGSRGTPLLFNLGVRWRWVVNVTPRPLYPGNNPVPTVQEAGLAAGPD